MATNLDSPKIFNPMMLWTDLGLRALETTLASSQNVSDGLDRLTRAGANADATEQAESSDNTTSMPDGQVALPGLELAGQMQRATFELMTQAWQQWLSTLGTLASLGAGRSFNETVTSQNPWLNAMRQGLQTVSTAPAAVADSVTRNTARTTERAQAAAEPKKPRRASRTRSKSRARNS